MSTMNSHQIVVRHSALRQKANVKLVRVLKQKTKEKLDLRDIGEARLNQSLAERASVVGPSALRRKANVKLVRVLKTEEQGEAGSPVWRQG